MEPINTDISTPSSQDLHRQANSKPGNKIGIIIGIIVLLLAGGLSWVFISRNSSNEEENTIEVVNDSAPTNVPTEAPSPTDSPEEESVDKEKITIQVLNGSGIAGEASYLQGVLANMDYSEIKTGNASKQNQETTTVTYKEDLAESVQDEITAKLKDVYKKVDAKTVASQKDYDVIITVGLRKNQTLPTAAPTKAVTPTSKPLSSGTTPTVTPSPSPSPSPTL